MLTGWHVIPRANGAEEGNRTVELVLLPPRLGGERHRGPRVPRGRAGADPKLLSGSEMSQGYWFCNHNQHLSWLQSKRCYWLDASDPCISVIRSYLCAHRHAPFTLQRAPSLSDNGYRECLANGSWAARVNYSQCQEILSEEVGPW